ncbi:undecaprenyldiphospho-muramoylpentapeptide beta-N-acetylglucosaminyltransferase [Longispora albida]|uniref:undecaprenyldiphospho-muramoylpentapeptide beta-N-acetylglucosaminyltransferase n=1 Tax=Longispora albida TaxID=203523 RepID=UPI00059181B3|nr:undecaprenyldiphospho-muramoylpentapeptide beta-N-acetylglucosaminyltransferase [Longispora albida]
MRSVVLAGGGTGGHIYPLLAFADCLRRHDPGIRITCLGTPKGLENELIPAAGYDLRTVPAYQLPRSVNLDLVKTPPRMWRAMQATKAIFDEVKAEAVVGFGGYVAVPAYLAAWRRKTPVVIHEVNVPPGVANKLGMKVGGHLALGFPGQAAALPELGGRVVGVPLRRSIATLDRQARRAEARRYFGLDPDRPTLFVFGASQGARQINLAVAGAARAITNAGFQILHIIGARQEEPLEIPTGLAAPYVTVDFLKEMELGYAAADMVLCRGGALTVAEVTTVGLPAIYVPLPYGNGEQRRNALPVVEAGGGLIVDNAECTPDWVARNIIPLLSDPHRLVAMGQAASGYGRRDGDEQLRNYVLEVAAR